MDPILELGLPTRTLRWIYLLDPRRGVGKPYNSIFAPKKGSTNSPLRLKGRALISNFEDTHKKEPRFMETARYLRDQPDQGTAGKTRRSTVKVLKTGFPCMNPKVLHIVLFRNAPKTRIPNSRRLGT